MQNRSHAVLSASSADRWLHCPPSVRLCESIKDRGSEYATEGTEAHALCEHRIRALLGLPTQDPIEDFNYYTAEMEECACDYTVYVLERLKEARKGCKDPVTLIEQRVEFSKYVPDGYGTADCLIIADRTLYIIDFKYGRGVEVLADHNPQLMCYSLGALELFDGIYDIDTVSMTIYQPRRGNVSTYTMAKTELLEWAEMVLAPAAQLAYIGEGEFSCGEWCRYCRARRDCKERARNSLALAEYTERRPALLTDEEIGSLLGRLDGFISWANDLKDYALKAAINGKSWDGWKLVPGKSNRKYMDESAVAETVKAAGYDPYEQRLLGVTAMTALLGSKRFNEILGDLVYRPPGKLMLVKKEQEDDG